MSNERVHDDDAAVWDCIWQRYLEPNREFLVLITISCTKKVSSSIIHCWFSIAQLIYANSHIRTHTQNNECAEINLNALEHVSNINYQTIWMNNCVFIAQIMPPSPTLAGRRGLGNLLKRRHRSSHPLWRACRSVGSFQKYWIGYSKVSPRMSRMQKTKHVWASVIMCCNDRWGWVSVSARGDEMSAREGQERVREQGQWGTAEPDVSTDKANQLIWQGLGRWKVLFPPGARVAEGSRLWPLTLLKKRVRHQSNSFQLMVLFSLH